MFSSIGEMGCPEWKPKGSPSSQARVVGSSCQRHSDGKLPSVKRSNRGFDLLNSRFVLGGDEDPVERPIPSSHVAQMLPRKGWAISSES
ncbi:hypothetical protein NKH73_12080 [Mesorhizobium sp. M0938]|uniref:hypothetical protein n=1 Tax=unclassified Mesorhizobium TaxID=325217 RepID=UPI00333AF1C3